MSHRVRIPFVIFLTALIALPALGIGAWREGVQDLNRLIEQSNSSEADQAFNEARSLIDNEDWRGAETRLRRFIDLYQRNRNTAAALYYLALALKKQNNLEEATRAIERILKEFPRSNWADDARNLRVEIASIAGNGRVIEEELNKDDLETKIIALQGLFMANPDRAAQIIADLLKPDSKSPRRLKEAAISLLGQHLTAQSVALLTNLARNEKDAKLRTTAIFWLGQSQDEASLDVIKELARSDDAKVSRAAIMAIAQNSSPRATSFLAETARSATSIEARKQAIFWLANSRSEQSVDELFRIYDADSNVEIRKQVLFALTQISGDRARAKLVEIARSGDDELRKQAIFWLGQRGDERTLETLIQIYDAEKNEKVKQQIIVSLAQSQSKNALRKLIDIARKDPSTALRKQAVFWIGQSRDPEAAKFLEEILK